MKWGRKKKLEEKRIEGSRADVTLGGSERAKKEGAHNDGNGMMKVEGKGNQIATDTHAVCVCVFSCETLPPFSISKRNQNLSHV